MNKLTERSFYLALACYLFSCSNKGSGGDTPPPPPPPPVTYEWNFESTPVWSDEFSTDGLPDATKWSYDIGGNGWGNNELQYYTDGSDLKEVFTWRLPAICFHAVIKVPVAIPRHLRHLLR